MDGGFNLHQNAFECACPYMSTLPHPPISGFIQPTASTKTGLAVSFTAIKFIIIAGRRCSLCVCVCVCVCQCMHARVVSFISHSPPVPGWLVCHLVPPPIQILDVSALTPATAAAAFRAAPHAA
jgi:hypothetical protein